MSQSAQSKYCQALAARESRLFERAIHCDPGAKKRRRFERRKTSRDFYRVACGGFHEFRIAAIHRHSRNFLLDAEIFVSFSAELALAARPVNPGHADSLTQFQFSNRGALFGYASRDFMSENQRVLDDLRKLRPIAIGNVQIRVANTARLHLDQNFVRAGLGAFDVFDFEGLLEVVKDGGSHSHPLVRDCWLVVVEWQTLTGNRRFKIVGRRSRESYGRTPRKKKSTALRTRPINLSGPGKSTTQLRTTVL